MINIKLVYLFNEPEYLCWTEKDDFGDTKFRKIKFNPIKEIYIDDIPYKRSRIQDVYKIEFLELCRKMDRYLLKKESIFKGFENLDIIKAYNTYQYKNYKLLDYQVIDNLVAIELEVL